MAQEIFYSSCWEDEDMVLKTLRHGDRALMIAAGGCSLFTGLLKEPVRLVGIDSNPAQVALVKLKIAAIEKLDDADLRFFLGIGYFEEDSKRAQNIYDRLKSELTHKEREYLADQSMGRGISSIGRFERYLDFFRRNLLPFFMSRSKVEQFLDSKSLEEQADFFHRKVNSPIYRFLFRLYFGGYWMRRKGRHPDLMKHLKEDPSNAFLNRMNRAWTEVYIRENPYFQRILKGFIPAECPPTWMRRQEIEKFKHLLKRVELVSLNFEDYIKVSRNRWDYFYLSDICEAITDSQAKSLFELCAEKAEKGARMVIMNNLLERRPSEDSAWKLNEELSAELWNGRRTSFYGFIGVYERA